jgi:hypothetical protein
LSNPPDNWQGSWEKELSVQEQGLSVQEEELSVQEQGLSVQEEELSVQE